MEGSSAATETVANHEETDRQRRKHDNEKDVQEFHGGIPSDEDGILFSRDDISCVSRSAGAVTFP